ncbi:hypothetical protein BU23DRAFT_131677 [Bimuria novae-zelandiae CBS 107.79]|uniref:Uncharacterized protein n=1 Tax=Bimuria novae-zelandiae CBS 107.79 TaxID=1447943 RepID=A0A6A5VJE5_9PLEO|nr:hypothetical protein BU23DRAFT_131677 [Bimuria novae-zelandiae CBS 107.79]
MEVGERDARVTRPTRTRRQTAKAALLRHRNAQHDTDSSDSSHVVEADHVNLEPPSAPRPNRTRRIREGQMEEAAHGNAEHTRALKESKGQNLESMLVAILGALDALKRDNLALKADNQELKTAVGDITRELADTKAQLADAKTQLTELTSGLGAQIRTSGLLSYADIARTPLSSQPSNLRTLSGITA